MPHSRPDLPYSGKALKNNKRYENLTKDRRAPTAKMFDSEMNYVMDSLNSLEENLKKMQAGKIVGSDQDTNKDKILKTDGKGNLSWVKVGSDELGEKEVRRRHLTRDCVGEDELQNDSVTSGKIRRKSVTKDHLASNSVGGDEIASSSIVNKHIPYGAQIEGRKIWAETMPLNRLTTKLEDGPGKIQGIVGIANGVGFGIESGDDGTFLRCKGKESWPEFVKIKGQDLRAGIIESAHLGMESVVNETVKKKSLGLDRLATQQATNAVLVTSRQGDIQTKEAQISDKTSFVKKKRGKDTSFDAIEMGDLPLGATPCYMARWRLKDLPATKPFVREWNPFSYVTKIACNQNIIELSLTIPHDRFIGIVTPEIYDASYIGQMPSYPFIARSSVKEKSLFIYNVNSDGALGLYKIV